VFTHFDQVQGPNLPSFTAREEHVLASVENVLKSIGEDLGPAAERVLRRRLDRARFFVGAIQAPLDATITTRIGRRSIQQLDNLLAVLAHPELAIDAGHSRPVFDRMNLSLAVAEAAKDFHARWRGLLGLDANAEVRKEHWTRIKALSRRLAEGWADGYDNLQPVADLRYELHFATSTPPKGQGPVRPTIDTAKNPFGCKAFFVSFGPGALPGVPGAASTDVIKDLGDPPKKPWHLL
jgi:hypothetical protein